MTIEFNCPNCDSVIAFPDKHIGKRAHCTNCGQSFVIPDKSYSKVKKIKPPKEAKSEPIPGFYRAALIDNWKIFLNPKNITGLAFILTATFFKFFTANKNFSIFVQGQSLAIDIYVPLGWLCRGIAWGFLFWYYREIIYSTGFDQEDFPEVILDGFRGLVWKIFESLYTLFIIFLAAGLPSLLLFFVFEKTFAEIPIILHALVLLGLFLLPAAIMNVAVGKDLTLLRTDYLIKQVARDFIPYVVIFILLAAAIFMQMFAKQYNPKEPSETWIYFLFNFAVQMVFIYAMRAIGLFYRHYSCHTPW
jgi:hypothetical protein